MALNIRCSTPSFTLARPTSWPRPDAGAVTVATNMAGRGVDIMLGGNADGLAERDTLAEGLELDSEEGLARVEELVAPSTQPDCETEGQKVKDLGGLYVLATERHDSRRIDNQLRGRSGRQGDPGESRFYLSLEDELMRLFATGAMDWVMKKALPDDIAIDSKMVTKAIERAQNTVEQRNAETRKNVLKYDEVMNEQRRVIYAPPRADPQRRRPARRGARVLGRSGRRHHRHPLRVGLPRRVGPRRPGVRSQHACGPTRSPPKTSGNFGSTDAIYEDLMGKGVVFYERREEEIGPDILRQIERQVMLRIIDQRWREHLYEMDYLKEGIHLRAMGQKDPLTEWQREGFEMFGQMMNARSLRTS